MQLEVVEVQRGARGLRLGVGVGVVAEQLVEQADGDGRAGIAARPCVRLERRAVLLAGRTLQGVGVRPEGQLGELRPQQLAGRRGLQQLRAALEALARRADGLAGAGQPQLGRGCRDGGLQRRAQRVRVGQAGGARQTRTRLAGAAQRVVGEDDRGAQAVGVVGGDEVERGGGVRAGQQAGERVVPGAVVQRARGGLVEHGERRVQPGGDRVGAQHARAEAVDRRDPGGLGLARHVAAAELDEALAHPRAQLARGALGERDREDPRGPHAVLEHRAHEALDEHRGLAAAGVGLEQQRAVRGAARPRTARP